MNKRNGKKIDNTLSLPTVESFNMSHSFELYSTVVITIFLYVVTIQSKLLHFRLKIWINLQHLVIFLHYERLNLNPNRIIKDINIIDMISFINLLEFYNYFQFGITPFFIIT